LLSKEEDKLMRKERSMRQQIGLSDGKSDGEVLSKRIMERSLVSLERQID